jgi:ABC-2 type transport system permease protein
LTGSREGVDGELLDDPAHRAAGWNSSTTYIIVRFKTMSIGRASVLTGHVLGTVLQSILAVAIVLLVALLVGFRPNANALEWLAGIATLLVVTIAFTWLYVAAALASNSVETASNMQLPLLVLPFLSSAFAPTDSMPTGLRWFAEHQPFTSFTDTVRGFLLGTEVGTHAVVTLAWCAGITLFGYVASLTLYNRDPFR